MKNKPINKNTMEKHKFKKDYYDEQHGAWYCKICGQSEEHQNHNLTMPINKPQLILSEGIKGEIEDLIWRVQKAYNSNPEDTYPISISEGTDGIMKILNKAISEAKKDGRRTLIKQILESELELQEIEPGLSSILDNQFNKNIKVAIKELSQSKE